MQRQENVKCEGVLFTDSGRAFAFLCLPPCDKLGTYSHPTNQCRRVVSAPNLLPKTISSQHFHAFPSNLPSSACAAQPEPAPFKHPPSTLRTHALLTTSSNKLTWSVTRASSSRLLERISCQFLLRLRIKGMPLWPLNAQKLRCNPRPMPQCGSMRECAAAARLVRIG